jgi:hypothetical protein
LDVLKFVWFCLLGVVGSATVLAGLYLPGAYTEFLSWLPVLFAFFVLARSVYVLNDSGMGEALSWRLLRDVLRALPSTVQAGLATAFVAVGIYHYVCVNSASQSDLLEFHRFYVAAGMWMCAVASALTYGTVVRKRGGAPPDPDERQAGWAVCAAVWAVALHAALSSLWHNA